MVTAHAYLPRVVPLPFGYRVTVRLVDEVDATGSRGDWDGRTFTIKIQKRLPQKQRLAVFLHEMRHALADWDLQVRDKYGLEP